MSADDEQGEGISLEEALAEAETPTASTEQAPTQPAAEPTQTAPPELLTDADRWRAELGKCTSAEEARKYARANAERLGWALGTAYRVVKTMPEFKSKNAKRAKVATFHISKAEVPDEPAPPAPPPNTGEDNPPPQPPVQAGLAPPVMPYPMTDQLQQLQTVIEHQAPKCLNHVFDIVGSKLGAEGNGEAFLDDQDSKDLAVLLPVLVKKATGGNMTPETTENVAIGSFAAQLTLKAVKNRLKNQPAKQPDRQPDQPAQKPAPEPAKPAPAQEPAAEKPAPEPEAPAEFKDSKPNWRNQLK